MQFHFHHPLYMTGADGVMRQVAEAEMMAELTGSPTAFEIDALYAFEFAPGTPRYEIKPMSPEFHLVEHYIRSNPQEVARIADEWPDDERPRRSVVNEHSTYVGAP
jgi:hypothetical protein